MWIFDGFSFTNDSPKSLTILGLPSDVNKVDAAFAWGKNGRTYIFAGERYKFDLIRVY